MKTCPACGQPQSSDIAAFCRNCGTALDSVPAADPMATVYIGETAAAPIYGEAAAPTPAALPGNKLFFSPDEQLVYVMGDQLYAQYVYGGEIKKDSFLAISNKRVYFRGDSRLFVGGSYRGGKVKANNNVDLCDVTGVISRYSRNPLLLVLTIIFAGIFVFCQALSATATSDEGTAIVGIMFLIFSIIMLIAYFLTMTKILLVEYAGGYIIFDAKNYTNAQIEEFQRALFQAKERALIARKNLSIY